MNTSHAGYIVLGETTDAVGDNDLSFEQTNDFILGFISDVLFSEPIKKELKLGVKFFNQAKELFSVAKEYFSGQVDLLPELRAARVKAWEIHDCFKDASTERAYMRILVTALYDQEKAEFDKLDWNGTLDCFIACIDDLGEKYCYLFRDYFLANLPRILKWELHFININS